MTTTSKRPTDRQTQVLHLLAEGLESKEIGQRMGVTVHTVHSTVNLMLKRYKIETRAGIVSLAYREGWLVTERDEELAQLKRTAGGLSVKVQELQAKLIAAQEELAALRRSQDGWPDVVRQGRL